MTALKVLIADDEPLAAERLTALMKPLEGLDLVGVAEDGVEALERARTHQPDLILLDISMPGMNGIEVARELASQPSRPAIIFVTAYDQFAVEAFEVAAVDYLMKPVERARFADAIARVREALEHRDPAGEPREESDYLTEFWASDLSGLVRIAAADIDRVSAERDYMRLHVGTRSWLIHHSMTALEKGLDPSIFVRLHRSAIVRRDFITGFARNASGRWIAQLADGSEQAVGRLYAERVREMTGR
ncbi:LytR/AlgR family response regulator transcription factor [Sphingomicrobium aestuariivivum]|uniref:LytR/AlgR family response regulator transcription factor n=1 Tax=Sphingomicrobium aestuariivivum TaxID=1582356 RepID=UPI001FD7109E|nr:LytTR family DNA-binding domain-containing protein [Sphingomicrobium aestuariivivum]MCJ8190401.1 LytTR family DNA-binding domain-containing protein [Sphingomicrobium aestuariivivum]